jgi:hypothetical protein
VEEHLENSQRRVHLRNLYREQSYLASKCDDAEPSFCSVVLAESSTSTDAARTWQVLPAPAEYPRAAFWAGPGSPGPRHLLWPLREMVDEHYNVYWDVVEAVGDSGHSGGLV